MRKSLIFLGGNMLILKIQNTECIKEKEKEELGVKVFYFKIFLFT